MITAPEALRSELRPLPGAAASALQPLPDPTVADPELRGTLLVLRSLARRILASDRRRTRARTRDPRATPRTRPEATRRARHRADRRRTAVVCWSHDGRLASEAAFARLAGAGPIPASSGQTVRYRLSRVGDRQLNLALHLILVTRKRTHPATLDYIARRVQKAKHYAKQSAPQALPRPQPLPATRTRTATDDLTDIEASLAQPSDKDRENARIPAPVLPTSDLLSLLREVPPRHRTLLVGIDGRGGSGKSTLARQLERSASDLTVVEFDDFYLSLKERKGRASRGEAEIGGNFDWRRLREQVLAPLSRDEPALYQRYRLAE